MQDAATIKVRAEQIVREFRRAPDDTSVWTPDVVDVSMVVLALTEGATVEEPDHTNPAVVKRVPKNESKVKRWSRFCADALSHIADAKAAIENLVDLKGEYESWRDNMPEGLENSPTAEKLDAIVDIDFDSVTGSLDEAESAMNDIEGADLPVGYGKD